MLSSKDIEYQNYVLCDVNVIELLLSYRYKYDDYLFYDDLTSPMAVSGAGSISEEVLVTYASIDVIIERLNLSEQQLRMLKMIGEGYTHEEIASTLKLNSKVISRRLKTIYRHIVKENERAWKKYIYLNKLDMESKTCIKCKERLPLSEEFFYRMPDSAEGFRSKCKKCF